MKNQLYNRIESISIGLFILMGFLRSSFPFFIVVSCTGFIFSLLRVIYLVDHKSKLPKDILLYRALCTIFLFGGLVFTWFKILHIPVGFLSSKLFYRIIVTLPVFGYILTVSNEWKTLKDKDFNEDTLDDIMLK